MENTSNATSSVVDNSENAGVQMSDLDKVMSGLVFPSKEAVAARAALKSAESDRNALQEKINLLMGKLAEADKKVEEARLNVQTLPDENERTEAATQLAQRMLNGGLSPEAARAALMMQYGAFVPRSTSTKKDPRKHFLEVKDEVFTTIVNEIRNAGAEGLPSGKVYEIAKLDVGDGNQRALLKTALEERFGDQLRYVPAKRGSKWYSK